MQETTPDKRFIYKDREVDWLSFNERVLQESADPLNPVYERLKFLAIFSSNLDEFFKVRISKLRQIKKVKKDIRKPLGLKPNKLLKTLLAEIDRQQNRFGEIFRMQILPELADHHIYLLEYPDYTEKQKSYLFKYFEEKIARDLVSFESREVSAEAFDEGELYILLYDENSDDLAFVRVPTDKIGRFIEIPGNGDSHNYTFLEDALKLNAHHIVPDMTITSMWNIKISKDAELYLDDDYEGDWVEQIYDSLAKRQSGQPTRLLYEKGMPKNIRNKLRDLLGLGKIDMFPGGDHHNFSDFFTFPNPTEKPALVFEPLPPLLHRDFEGVDSIFESIQKKDRLIHFPYQAFGYLENWLIEASEDPEVVSIQISLYRIARKSRLTFALLRALDNGKEVTIFVEAKARFDEENNINWGKKFDDKGAGVYYSFPNVKVHSKILYVERREKTGMKGYAYIGTGNFNATTSGIYCDHGFFTANSKITRDIEQVFKVLKREILLPKLKVLLISPYNARSRFIGMIQREIDNAHNGRPAKIMAKMNSLEDQGMINWLYRASNAGVQIRLLVRGFCCLVPQIQGQSENIEVISIVDRFLEHGRVFLFYNNGDEELYMGSADWMTRNLDKRIEVITPIVEKEIFSELKDILEIQFADNVKARVIDKDANNTYIAPETDEKRIRSQYAIYNYLKEK